MHGRVSAWEASHAKLLNDTKGRDAKHQTIEERLEALEGQLSEAGSRQAKELKDHAATLSERVKYLERTIGDSADKHAKALQEAHAKHDDIHGRVSAWEASHAKLLNDARSRDAKHQSIEERLEAIESSLGDVGSRHSKELRMLGDNHDKHAKALEDATSKHDDMHGRISAWEASHAKLLSDVRNRDAKHQTIEQRLEALESGMTEIGSRQSKELKQTRTKLDMVNGQLAAVRDAWRHEF